MYELTRESQRVWLYGGLLFRLDEGEFEVTGEASMRAMGSGAPLLARGKYDGDPATAVQEIIAGEYQKLVDIAIGRGIRPLRWPAWLTGCDLPWEIVRIEDPDTRVIALLRIMLIVHHSFAMWWYGGLRFMIVGAALERLIEVRAARNQYVAVDRVPAAIAAAGRVEVMNHALRNYQALVDMAIEYGCDPTHKPPWTTAAWDDCWESHDLPWEILRLEDSVAREEAAAAYREVRTR